MSVSTARIILNQLGGNRFVAMTGAKDFVTTDNAISFRIGRNTSEANKVRITLEPTDTYSVEFFQLRGIDCSTISRFEFIHVEELGDIFTRITGLRISL